MSKSLLSFYLRELTVIRILCKKEGCGGIVEMPTEKLKGRQDIWCPLCRTEFNVLSDGHSAFASLGQSIGDLTRMKDCDLEFVIPADKQIA